MGLKEVLVECDKYRDLLVQIRDLGDNPDEWTDEETGALNDQLNQAIGAKESDIVSTQHYNSLLRGRDAVVEAACQAVDLYQSNPSSQKHISTAVNIGWYNITRAVDALRSLDKKEDSLLGAAIF